MFIPPVATSDESKQSRSGQPLPTHRYKKQYLAFKDHLHKAKESFKKEKGLLFNMFLLPLFLSLLGVFYIVRYFLRIFIPEGCFGHDWDQARLEQAKPNFIFLFICDLGLIGFVKACSKIYCEGTKIDLYIPIHGKWQMWHPAEETMDAVGIWHPAEETMDAVGSSRRGDDGRGGTPPRRRWTR